MKKSLAATLYGAVAVTLIGFATSAAAVGFSGPYEVPGNWTTDLGGGNGSVITSGTPISSITIIGSDYTSVPEGLKLPVLTSFTNIAAGKGKVEFRWDYETFDTGGPGLDQAGYWLNGIRNRFSDDEGFNTQNGDSSFDVIAGSIFGFYVESIDGEFGEARLTISSFSAPIPEPGQAAMLALGLLLMGYVGSRKRKQT